MMAAGAATVTAGAQEAGRRPRVLVVEDDPSSRDAKARLLRLRGLDVQPAATLGEAFAALAWGPNCIILDLMLPDGTGTALLAHVRAQRLPARVAVVTATGEPDMLEQVKRLRPELLLRKPINVKDLMAWLDEC
jgi:CheY-like chemotaxis protein